MTRGSQRRGGRGHDGPCLSKTPKTNLILLASSASTLTAPNSWVFHTRQVNILEGSSLDCNHLQTQTNLEFLFCFLFCLISNLLLFMRCGVYKGLNQMNVTKRKKKKKMPFLRASELQIIFKEKPIIASSQ